MSLVTTTNAHVEADDVTRLRTFDTFASVGIESPANLNQSVHLLFADLAHVERWVRDLLGQVEVAKIELANDQHKIAAPDPVPVQPAGEVSALPVADASPATSDEPPLIGAAARDFGRYQDAGGNADWPTWWARYSDNYVTGMEYTGGVE